MPRAAARCGLRKNTLNYKFFDSFDRADSSTLGTTSDGKATYTNVGPGVLGVSSNQCYVSTGSSSGAKSVFSTGSSDIDQSIKIATLPTNGELGLVSRYSDTNNQILVLIMSTALVKLFKVQSGAFTNIFTGAAGDAFVAGDTLRVVWLGTNISIYRNTTILYNATGPTLNPTATIHGLYGSANGGTNAGRLDNYAVA